MPAALAVDAEGGDPLRLLADHAWRRPKLDKPRKRRPEDPTVRRARRVLIATKESFRWLSP